MHKHLTGALTAESRQDHRLKTALAAKSRVSPAEDANQANQRSLAVQYAGSAAIAVGGQAQLMRQQRDPLHELTAGCSSGARAAGPGSLWASGIQAGMSEQPVRHYASDPTATVPGTAAAASRLNAALTAAINTSPSKTRHGSQYSEQQQPQHGSYRHQPILAGQQSVQARQELLQSSMADSGQQPSQFYPKISAIPHAAQQPADATGTGSVSAAAVQLAAGVAITAETTMTERAGTKPKKSSKFFSKGSRRQQQSEQQTPAEATRQNSTTTTFGMRLSGSMVAAFNGWLVNEAVNAATAAATAAFSPAQATDVQSPAAAAEGPRRRGSRGDDSAAAAPTPSRWSLSGLLARSISIEQQRQQAVSDVPVSKSAGPLSCSDVSSLDEDYAPSDTSAGIISTSSDSTSGSSSFGSIDPVTSEELAEAAAFASATATGTDRTQGSAGLYTAIVGQHASRGPVAAQPGVSWKVKAVKEALLWHDKSISWKALGCGLYLILLIGYIPKALEYMQVTTLLPGTALTYLAYNLTKPWAIRGYCHLSGKTADRMAARLATFELSATEQLIQLSSKAAAELGGWTLAVLVLAQQALRGQRFTTTAWTVLSLWLLLLISELRVLNQTLLAMVAYAGLFSVPWLYNKFKHSIDTLVCEAVHFLTLLLFHAERWAYGLALVAAGLVWQLLDSEGGSLVVRGSAAGVAAVAVLVWRVAVADV